MKTCALIPEVNLLLKLPIEAGASLEALPKGNKKIPDKRKRKSICMPYYRTRRRIKFKSFNSPELSFFDKCINLQHHVTLDHQAQVGDVMLTDCLDNNYGSIAATDLVDKSADGCHVSIGNYYINDSMREDELCKLNENACLLLRDNLMGFFDLSMEPKDDSHRHIGDSDDSSALTEVEYASRLSLSSKDYIHCSLNTEDMVDDIPDSQLLDSAENVLDDPSFHGDQQDVCYCEDDMESTPIKHLDPVHLSEVKITCMLNTEDPDIPCNDNIFLVIHPSPTVRPQTATESIDPTSSVNQSQTDGPELSSDFHSVNLHVGCTLKSVSMDHNPSISDHNNPDSDSNLPWFPGIKDSEIPSPVRPQTAADSIDPTSSFIQSQMDGSDLSSEFGSAYPHVGNTFKYVSVDHNPSISNCNNSDSDSDQPCFPDIEALILKLDFEYAQESWITNEVKRHKYKHSKRTINSLEYSSSQRSMSSLGAFAVFYSHHFNYYIKKTEVTIGRSTDDIEVDIDLRKESHANMISRKHATIKMETDGTFTLKNIGKGSILTNGKSIAHGQVAALGSSCPIQIRGMDFMFEINDGYVKWYLDNIMKKTQGKFTTFEWSVN